MINTRVPLCSAQNVSKTFTTTRKLQTQAVTDVTIDIHPGEFLVFIGPSGCGKTTLLRLLAGLLIPSSGSITYNTHHHFGFVFQSPTLLPWRTVEQNVCLPAEIRHRSYYITQTKMHNLMKLLKLKENLDRFPHELSGGMQQRAAIARALVSDPTLLFMDEPFSALDELLRQKLNFELLRIKKELHQTIVFVTHTITEAVLLADRLVIFSMNPNTVKCITPIVFDKRSPELLMKIEFFKTVTRVRKLLEKE